MERKEINVEKWMKWLRTDCQFLHSTVKGRFSVYNDGWIRGILHVLGKDIQDLCGMCEGCNNPFAPHKNMEE